MRTLPAELTAAQKAAHRTPYLKVQISDRLAGIRRLRPAQWYAGAEPDEHHASIVAANGSLIRVRLDGTTLYRSVTGSPAIGQDYSIWTSWATVYPNGVALAKLTDGTIICFVVRTAGDQVHSSYSTDHGASWSAFALEFTHTANVNFLAACGASSTTNLLLIVATAGDTSVSAYRESGGWTGPTTKTGLPTITGLAVHHTNDWNTLITGTDAAGDYVQRLLFGDGFSQAPNTWSSALTIHEAHDAAAIAYAHPFLARPDVTRATFRQQHTGTQAYDRTMRTQQTATAAFVDNLWREPVPTNIVAPYGLCIAHDASNVFYTTARYVYHATLDDGQLDVTAHVASARLYDRPLSPILSHVDLDNAAGTYTDLTTGAVSVITHGAEARVSPGYITSAGAQSSWGPGFHIAALEHTYDKGRAILRLHLGSQATHLARHRFPRAVTFAEGAANIYTQLAYIFARVGYEFSSSGGSSDLANLYPPLVIPPATSALTAIRRSLDRVPDAAISRGEFFFANEPLAADTADATYERGLGSADQRIEAAAYVTRLKDANHIQIFAEDDASIVAEDLDYAEIDLLYSAPLQRHDPFLDSGAEAVNRAAYEQRRQVVAATIADRITAPVHCGLEVNDVIAITDAKAGLSAAKRRVLGLVLAYDRARTPRYHHTIELGAS